MAQGPRHLVASFVSTGLRKIEQTLTSAEKAQVLANLGAPSSSELATLTSTVATLAAIVTDLQTGVGITLPTANTTVATALWSDSNTVKIGSV